MEPFAALEAAVDSFGQRLGMVGEADWSRPTPCDGWSVLDLCSHVVGGNTMAVRLLDGASTAEAVTDLTTPLAGNPVDAFAATATAQLAAFEQPGALERIVHHPAMDMPGAQLLGFRIGDLTLHSWDLARAIAQSEELDTELVRFVWDGLQPMAPFIGQIGVFGTGPSGEVPDDAPLQRRLLDLTGRRP